MLTDNHDSVQLLNTAVVKSKEKIIDNTFEDRLSKVCNSEAIKSISIAIEHLSESQKISRDDAATQIVETLRELDNIWSDYVMMEGIGKLKDLLQYRS